MRILVVHNRYSSRVPSGENLAVDDEVRWLREAGVEVETYQVSNDDIVEASGADKVRQAVHSLWSLPAARRFEAVLERVRPDVVHIHNLFPLLTASVPRAASRRGVPVVWTVHNYRTVCVAGTFFRDGHPCHLCRPGWRLPGIHHGCFGGSRAASALIVGATSAFARMARQGFTALAISEAVGRWLTEIVDLGADRVVVKYNGVAGPPEPHRLADACSQRTFLFAGHVSAHKGVELLLDAWQRTTIDAELRIVGNGPLVDLVRRAALADRRIRWVDQVPAEVLGRHLEAARAVIVPSTWDEPYGRAAAEALAYGRPVITTGSGGLGEIVDESTGWITGTDPDDLTSAIITAAQRDDIIRQRGEAALRRHSSRFSPEATTAALLVVYQRAMHDLAFDPRDQHTVATKVRGATRRRSDP